MDVTLTIKKTMALIVVAFAVSPVFANPQRVKLPVPRHTPSYSKIMSLREAVLLALRNNPAVRNAKLDRVVQKFSLEVAHNEFEPQFTTTGSATMHFSPSGKPEYTLDHQAKLKTTLGTEITADFNNQLLSGGENQPNLGLTITQPLLRGFGEEINKASLLSAIDSEEVNRLALKNSVMTAITQVISDYYAVVQSKLTLEANQRSLDRQKELYEISKVKVKAGKLAPSDLIQQLADLSAERLAVLQQENSIRETKQTLLSDLGLDPRSNINVEEGVDTGPLQVPDIDRSIAIAMDKNIDYLTNLITIRATARNVLVEQDQQRWELNATFTGSWDNRGFWGKMGPSSVDTTPDTSLALNLDIPLDDKERQQGLVDAKIALKKARIDLAQQKRDVKTSVINSANSLDLITKQIAEQKLELQYSKQGYQTGRLQYKYGKITYLNFEQLQDQLTSSETSKIDDGCA